MAKGRIYERRCDLSPDGQLLLYFAAKYRPPLRSWSAVSRPPYLTAIAMWPKGNGWGGGGRFLSNSRIELNHRKDEMAIGDGFPIPNWFKVKPFVGRPGWGEDDPVWPMRLERDGWKLIGVPQKAKDDFGAKVWVEFSPPIVWERKHPKEVKIFLRMSIHGLKERDGAMYITAHSVLRNEEHIDLGRTEWADWSHHGDLLFTSDGRLYRIPFSGGELAHEPVEIADFTDNRFAELQAPDNMRKWPRR